MNDETKQLKYGVILTYLTIGVQLLVGLIYTPLMIRLLGQSEYGLYNLASSMIAYLGLLSFGFGSAYIRFFSVYKKDENDEGIEKLNGMFLIIFIIISIITLLSGGILTYFADIVFGSKITPSEIDLARVLMIMLTINLAISFPTSVIISNIRANQRFVFQNSINLIKNITSPLVTLPILLLGFGSIGMVLVMVIINIIVEIIYFIYAKSKLNFKAKFRDLDLSIFKDLAVFSSFIFINMVIDQINWQVDKFILGRFHGTISVAIYSLAATLNTQYLSLGTAVSSVFTPRVHLLANQEGSDEKLTELFIKVGRIQFIIVSLFLSGFVLFGKPFMQWWGGVDYIDSYYILVILIIPVTIPLIQNVGLEIQRAKNKHKFRSLVYLVIAILNIFLSIPLSKTYQGIGAAIGTGVSLLIGNVLIMNIYYHKTIGINIIYFWIEIIKLIPALLITITMGFLYVKFVDIYNAIYFVIGFVGFSLLYVISMWLIGMNNFEKGLVKQSVNKLFNSK